jgi:hypothetical protein
MACMAAYAAGLDDPSWRRSPCSRRQESFAWMPMLTDQTTKPSITRPTPTRQLGPGEQGGSVLGKLHFVGKPSSEDAVSTLAVGCGFDR